MKNTALLLIALFVLGSSGCSYLQTDMRNVNRGYDSLLNDDLQTAEERFDDALETNPDNPYALLDLGVVYERTGRIEEAKALYQKVINIEQENPTKPARVSESAAENETLRSIAINNLSRLETMAPSQM